MDSTSPASRLLQRKALTDTRPQKQNQSGGGASFLRKANAAVYTACTACPPARLRGGDFSIKDKGLKPLIRVPLGLE